MNEALNNMLKGLAIHYLHRGTVEEAIEQGRTGGVPEELLQCLPGMMFEVTSAAGAIFGGARDFDEVVDELTRRALASGNTEDFGREDAAALVKSTIEFCRNSGEKKESNGPCRKKVGHGTSMERGNGQQAGPADARGSAPLILIFIAPRKLGVSCQVRVLVG